MLRMELSYAKGKLIGTFPSVVRFQTFDFRLNFLKIVSCNQKLIAKGFELKIVHNGSYS